MNRIILYLLGLFLLNNLAKAQKLDTIYLDNNFHKTDAVHSSYTRIVACHPKIDKVYVQTDYYATGEVKQICYYASRTKKEITSKNYQKLINREQLIPYGTWTSYYEPGMPGIVRTYDAGKEVESFWMDYNLNEKIYITLAQMPIFPGGPNALKSHITREIRYPMNAAAMGSSGKAYVSFWVNKKGEVFNVHLARSTGSSLLDKEAIRVVSTIPNFFPGLKDGVPVITSYTIPVAFKLQ